MPPVTLAIARPEHRPLLRSALLGLLAVALAMLVAALISASRLEFSAGFILKSLLVFGAGALLVLRGLPAHHPFRTLGPANGVTLVRGALVALLAGLIGERAPGAPTFAVAIAVAVIVLDGVDGWLARRTRMASRFGARFDMETDAVLVAVLALLAWQFGKVGAWVLLSGLMRYLFLAAGALVPLLRRPVPSSYRGKSIAVVQILALIVAIAPFSSVELATAVAAIALGLLTGSFLLDAVWLVQHSDSGGGESY
jgi:phosphatidylglycerophosphate synthase